MLLYMITVTVVVANVAPGLDAAIIDRPDKAVLAGMEVEEEGDGVAVEEKTVECEFFDQSCARGLEEGKDISSCFGSRKCQDEVADGEEGGGEKEAFCYTVWQNGTGLPGAWNIKKQGCLVNHGNSQVPIRYLCTVRYR